MTALALLWRRIPLKVKEAAVYMLGLTFVVFVHFYVVGRAREEGELTATMHMAEKVEAALEASNKARAGVDSGIVRVDTLWREHKAQARRTADAIKSIPVTQRDTIRLYFPQTDTALVESAALVADTLRLEAEGRRLRAELLNYRSTTEGAMAAMTARVVLVERDRDRRVSKGVTLLTDLASFAIGYAVGSRK